MKSLIGAPVTVGRQFYCSSNMLTSLEGSPRKIGKSFDCSQNQLTLLEGGPQSVGSFYRCYDNPLISLNGLADKFHGIDVSWNSELPLLRLVGHLFIISKNTDVNKIMMKYKGSPSRSNILACQRELIEAGFEGNAKW